jgi:hypothetical protein
MRFMVIRKADEETEAGVLPGAELLDAMIRYNEELVTAGVLVSGEGLLSSAHAALLHFDGAGTTTVTDGPFTETKELVAGFTMMRADSLEEVIEWVKKWPAEDGHGNVEIEIRQVQEEADFGAPITGDNRAYAVDLGN